MSRYDLSRGQLAALLSDQPPYRVDQVFDGLYRRLAEPGELTELPRELRYRLEEDPALAAAFRCAAESVVDGGSTVKWLLETADRKRIETVLMRYRDRTTVCISSQAGCAMACTFCATGDAGFGRQLSSGEIVEQVVLGTRRCASEGWGRLANVVLMGMGEPLANFGAVWPAVETMNRDLGLAARHLTISTVGVVPGIRKLATKPLQVNLAVSLHAANDALRDELVPLNRRYPIAMLMQACARVPGRDREEDLLRVGVHRRRQRPPFGRVRARRAGSAARGSRQPHPAQPDSRWSIAGPCRVASRPDPLAPGAAQRRRRQHHDPSEPGARHRRRMWPARCRRRARREAHAPGCRAGGSSITRPSFGVKG